jgi:phospholipid/cholesterol/gamma-HCH transport system substrate-binding protein/paraquat-inducible protein B
MDAKPHYFRIGVFVLVALTLIVMTIVLFGAGLFAQDKLHVESYFTESITGLSIGSPVQFRGVQIGQVEEIGFVGSVYSVDQNAPAGATYASYVRVVSGILRSKFPVHGTVQIETLLEQMVQRGLRTQIFSNLLTQQAYLEMNFLDPNRFPAERVRWTPKYPFIPSAPSEFGTITNSINRILGQLEAIDAQGLAASLERVFTSLNTAITEAHLAELSKEARGLLQAGREKVETLEMDKINAGAQQFVASLNRAVEEANVPGLSRQIRGILDQTDQKLAALDARKINADIERLLTSLDRAVAEANVPALSGQAQALMAELRTTNQHLKTLFAPPPGVTPAPNVPEAVARLSKVLTNFNALISTERPGIERVLNDLREITDSLKELIATLEQNPSELLFSRPPKRSEVVK